MKYKEKLLPATQYFLFWSWNLIFVLLIIFLLGEQVIIPITAGLIKGATPVEQGLFALILFVVPIAAIGFGLSKNFRKHPARLIKLYFGVELPLFFLAMARLFITSELQAATIYLLLVALIGIFAFTYQLFTEQKQKSEKRQLAELISLLFSLLFGLYIGVLLLFISIPLFVNGVAGFFNFEWLTVLSESPIIILFAIFVVYTATLFAGLPVMLCITYSLEFIKKYRVTNPLFKNGLSLAVVLAVIATNIVIFHFSNIQPQAHAFALLEKPIHNDEDRKMLLTQTDEIRDGLLNGYLMDYRYAANTADNRFIKELYAKTFHLEKEGLPTHVQTAFNAVAAPFLYDGKGNEHTPEKIAELYEAFFDEAIEKAERTTIRAALKSNWRRDGIEAGLIDTNREKVWIENQSIKIEESEYSARITLQETYRNQTYQRQEILYHFSLPAEAAITGLWLSDDKQNLKKYPYTVSPRGAAQKLYKQEVQRRIDPALLEQVGPYQYRLRIFPIPAKTNAPRSSIKTESKPMYMQLQYVVPLTETRQWSMPNLLERRNAFWNNDTQLILADKIIDREDDSWWPGIIPSHHAAPLNKKTIRVSENNSSRLVEVSPRAENKLERLSKNYAILIDTSYSMHRHKGELRAILNEFQRYADQTTGKVDTYLVGKSVQFVNDMNVEKQVFFGHAGHLSHLKTWQQYEHTTKYDAIVLVTDEGAYELKENIELKQDITASYWLLHVDDAMPYAYDDNLYDMLLKSKGGVATDFQSIAYQTEHQSLNVALSDTYEWHFNNKAQPAIGNPDTQLSAIAAKQYITHKFQSHKSNQLESLDLLHQLAIEQSIVTPFSSMIVLVNEQQKQDLKRMSAQADRFEREVETGRKLSDSPVSLAVEGVPEPQEWALIFVVTILLASAYMRRLRKDRMFFNPISR